MDHRDFKAISRSVMIHFVVANAEPGEFPRGLNFSAKCTYTNMRRSSNRAPIYTPQTYTSTASRRSCQAHALSLSLAGELGLVASRPMDASGEFRRNEGTVYE